MFMYIIIKVWKLLFVIFMYKKMYILLLFCVFEQFKSLKDACM